MQIRRLTALFLILGFSHFAHASLFRGECHTTFGSNPEVAWEADLDTQNDQVVKSLHQDGSLQVELTIAPGAAAFADVMTVKVTTPKTEFELMSLLSNRGYGSVIYSGKLDGESFSLECVVTRTRK
jgi:hypothetical protein